MRLFGQFLKWVPGTWVFGRIKPWEVGGNAAIAENRGFGPQSGYKGEQ